MIVLSCGLPSQIFWRSMPREIGDDSPSWAEILGDHVHGDSCETCIEEAP